jgi:hypothetical protein
MKIIPIFPLCIALLLFTHYSYGQLVPPNPEGQISGWIMNNDTTIDVVRQTYDDYISSNPNPSPRLGKYYGRWYNFWNTRANEYESFLGGIQARNILNFMYGYTYSTEPYYPIEDTKKALPIDETSEEVIVNKEILTEDFLYIYPNPSEGIFMLDFNESIDNQLLTIYNSQGIAVYEKSLDGIMAPALIDVGDLPAGAYYCCLRINNLFKRSQGFSIIKD